MSLTDAPRDPADMTLDELRFALAPAIAEAAIFDGWSEEALASAADVLGVDAAVARLAFKPSRPGGLPMEMISAFIATVDDAMVEAFPPERIATMKIRDRIRELVQFRLDAIAGLEEAVRRALAIMAMPQNVATAAKTGWHSADVMWRVAGDTATDYNHYTKRAILASIYSATLAVFIDDTSEGKAETRAFLDRRIEGVMTFEKVKAKWLNPEREHFSLSRFLGRLRYPAK